MCGRHLRYKGKERREVIWSGAVMCAACWCGWMTAGPDEIREPLPIIATSTRLDDDCGFCGSLVRPIVLITSIALVTQ